MFLVYMHMNKANGKRYVGWTIMRDGQSCTEAMTRRWNVHCLAANNGSRLLFHRAIRKHGTDAWHHEVLEVMSSREGVKHAEKLWIAQRETCAFDHPNKGYNMTRGGDGGGLLGHKFTLEHRMKISKARLGMQFSEETRHKMSLAKRGDKNYLFGKQRSIEVRQKIRTSQCGALGNNAKLTETKKLEIIEKWNNRNAERTTQHKLASEYGVTQSTISRLINGRTWK